MRPTLSHLALCTAAICGCASGSMVNQTSDPVLVMVSNSNSLRYNKDVRVVTTHLAGTPESLWPSLQAAYTKLGLPLTSRDAAAHALASQNTQVSGRFNNAPISRVVDCGLTPLASPRADSYRVWLNVASQLQPDGTGTELRTSVVANAQDQTSSTSAVQCGTTGSIEGQIARELGAP